MFSKHQKNEMILLLVKLVLIAVDTYIFSKLWFKYYAYLLWIPFTLWGHVAVIGSFAVIYTFLAKIYGGFDFKTTRAYLVFYSNIIATVMTGILMFFVIWFVNRRPMAVLPLLKGMVMWGFCDLIWAKPAVKITNRLYPPARTVIIYDNEFAFQKGLSICRQVPNRFKVVDTIPVTEDEVVIAHKLQVADAEAVMLCGIHSSQRNDLLKFCINANIPTYIRPNIGDFLLNSAQSMQMADLPILLSQRSAQSPIYTIGKRIFDIVFALAFLVILSPIFLITAIAIKLYDKGPVFYSQVRLTKDGRKFRIYKFRSMKVDAEKDTGARLAAEHDSRITPVGKIIRACRIDEMPQMINILKGDMSVVGPRPERPEIAEEYERTMPEFSLRLQVKAGLTGYAQVHGKYNTSPYDKLQMDLMYIAKQSFSTDLLICMETVKILFMKDSTEGIGEDQTTAETAAVVQKELNKKTESDVEDIGLISVVMAAYNSEKTIHQAVQSVVDQTYTNWELLVLDDCSSDNTISIVESFHDPRIRIIRNETNLGVSQNRHRGFTEAKGKWIAILDSDDAWMPGKLEAQAKRQIETGGKLFFTASYFMNKEGVKVDYVLHVPQKVNYHQLLSQNVISNSSALVDKELLLKNEVLNDKCHEDFACWLKILRGGETAYGVDQPLLVYRLSAASKSSNKVRAARMNWNTYGLIGLNIFSKVHYMIWYTVKGLKKYKSLKWRDLYR